jgi:hypothetical protein
MTPSRTAVFDIMRLAGFEPATRGLEDGSWFR